MDSRQQHRRNAAEGNTMSTTKTSTRTVTNTDNEGLNPLGYADADIEGQLVASLGKQVNVKVIAEGQARAEAERIAQLRDGVKNGTLAVEDAIAEAMHGTPAMPLPTPLSPSEVDDVRTAVAEARAEEIRQGMKAGEIPLMAGVTEIKALGQAEAKPAKKPRKPKAPKTAPKSERPKASAATDAAVAAAAEKAKREAMIAARVHAVLDPTLGVALEDALAGAPVPVIDLDAERAEKAKAEKLAAKAAAKAASDAVKAEAKAAKAAAKAAAPKEKRIVKKVGKTTSGQPIWDATVGFRRVLAAMMAPGVESSVIAGLMKKALPRYTRADHLEAAQAQVSIRWIADAHLIAADAMK